MNTSDHYSASIGTLRFGATVAAFIGFTFTSLSVIIGLLVGDEAFLLLMVVMALAMLSATVLVFRSPIWTARLGDGSAVLGAAGGIRLETLSSDPGRVDMFFWAVMFAAMPVVVAVLSWRLVRRRGEDPGAADTTSGALMFAALLGVAFTVSQAPLPTIVANIPLAIISLAIPAFPRRALWLAGAIVLAAIVNLVAAISGAGANAPGGAVAWLVVTLLIVYLVRKGQRELDRRGGARSPSLDHGVADGAGPHPADHED